MSGEEAPKHGSLIEALVGAQSELPAIDRDQENPHYKTKFVSLGNLLSKTRPVLNRHGLAVMQRPLLDEHGNFVLRTQLLHTSGEDMSFDSPLTPSKNDSQGQGSAITYMRRYTLAALLAIADQDDDDGEGATNQAGKGKQQKQPPAPKKRQKPATVGALVEDLQRIGWKPAEVLKWLASELGVAKHQSHKNVSDVLATLSDTQANALMSEIQRRADAEPVEQEAPDAAK